MQRFYLSGGQYGIEWNIDGGNKEKLYIGGDAYSAAAVYIKQNGVWTLNYIFRDYLGSITHIAHSNGVVKQELSYDAWGNLRDPKTQVVYVLGSEPALLLGRGYTGHEHLNMYGLINMNARLYDPIIGRFLSPDPYIQAPDFSQNFNRYSYALNNPLRFTDPNGEFIFSALLPGIGIFIDAALWGAVIGGAIGGTSAAIQEGDIGASVCKGAIVGFVGGAGMSFLGNVGLGAGQGAVTGMLGSALHSENLLKGAMWGAVSGAAFATITSSEMKNMFKGKGFKSNQRVFDDIMNSGSTTAHQDALDYFGFKGKYDQAMSKGNSGVAYRETGDIYYGNSAFESYERLKFTADHELIHSKNILSGKWDNSAFSANDIYHLEESYTHLRNVQNSGLYKGLTLDPYASHAIGYRLDQHVNHLYNFDIKKLNLRNYSDIPTWKKIMYNLPRRW